MIAILVNEVEEIQSETKLWDNFVSGEKEAFKTIYTKHVDELFRFGLHFTQNEDIVSDAIQDVFIDIYNYHPHLRSGDRIKQYLFISLKRKIFRLIKEENKHTIIDLNQIPFSYDLIDSEVETNENENEKLRLLDKAMKKLSDRQREAIYLRYVKGHTYDELSRILEMNYQSTRNLIHRGMNKLRDLCREK